MARVKIFPACERLICAQNSIFDMMRARSGLVGVRGAAVRDDGGPPSVPGRGRGGPLQQHRQHGGQVGRSSGGGRRLGSAVRTVQVSPDMEQGGQGYLQRGMSYCRIVLSYVKHIQNLGGAQPQENKPCY